MLQALVHDAEAPLVAALGTDDQAVIDPIRQLRLAAQECGQLLQQLHKGGGCFDADETRNVPALQLMVMRVAEIEIAVSRGIHVEIIVAAGNVSRFRGVGVVVVTACAAVFHVAAPGDIGRLVAADTRLTGPQREVTPAQIKIAHLLAAAVNMFVLGSFDPQPEAVDAFRLFGHSQGHGPVFLSDQQLELAFQVQLCPLLGHPGSGQGQGAALNEVILDLEIAAVHIHTLFAVTDIDHGSGCIGMQQHIAAVFQGKDLIFANDLHGCPFSAVLSVNNGAPCFRPADRGERPA